MEYGTASKTARHSAEQHSTNEPHQFKVYACQVRDGEAKRQLFRIELKVRFREKKM
jgi:hypothetical protein